MHEKPATMPTQHSGIEWKHSGIEWRVWNGNGATANVAGKIYLLISLGGGEVEVDWRYQNSDKWHFIHDKMIFPDLQTAKQWCEMHHATGAGE